MKKENKGPKCKWCDHRKLRFIQNEVDVIKGKPKAIAAICACEHCGKVCFLEYGDMK